MMINDFVEYLLGQFFSKHEDSYFARTEDEVSFYTVNIYLNEEFENGATRFFDDDSDKPYAKYKPSKIQCENICKVKFS